MTNLLQEHLNKLPPTSFNMGEESPTPAIFHYTTFRSLLGIVETKTFWASNIHYLNDSSEFIHAIDIARHVINGVRPEFGCTFLDAIENRLGCIENLSLYVASFSEKEDVLSQWRGYAGGGGVCLGFSFQNIKAIGEKNGFKLVKCLYDQEEKHAILLGIIVQAIHNYRDIPVEQGVGLFLRDFLQIAPAFKNKSFYEEKEWRLISSPMPNTSDSIGFRATDTMLIPYYKINLDICKNVDKNGKHKIGIGKIIVGPNGNKKLARDSAINLFVKNNVCWNSAGDTQAPLRTNI